LDSNASSSAGNEEQPAAPRRTTGRSGIPIGSILGIRIHLDYSVFIIFTLLVVGLAGSVMPSWHPDWPVLQVWAVALAAGVLFFISLVAHELAHSLVARARGIQVPRITLFVFGGVSEMAEEPADPKSELLITIVGPATSLVLGFLFTMAGAALAGDALTAELSEDPVAAMANVGPVATLLLWLGPINLILGLFNLVPGFPLDGGRVLRAVIWWMTGDVRRATRIAANAGRLFGWLLMAFGLTQVFAGAMLGGFWLILIGWFLANAASSSHAQLLERMALEGCQVRDLMRTRFEVVEPDLPLRRFVDERLLRRKQEAWPVLDGEDLVGMITFDSVREALEGSPEDGILVRDAMEAVDRSVRPTDGGRELLKILAESSRDPLAVVEDGRLVGLIDSRDVGRWMTMHSLRDAL